MKYFAKYLPVEGEIKRHDMTFFKNDTTPLPALDHEHFTIKTYNECGAYKKAQLFLCSRDFKEGDTVRNIETGEERVLKNDAMVQLADMQARALVKVIGPISPEATWVKEGDEFESNQLLKDTYYTYDHTASGVRSAMKIEEEVMVGETFSGALKITSVERCVIHIKGPCNHFH